MNPDCGPRVWYRRRKRGGRFWYQQPTGTAQPYELRHCANPECGELFFGRHMPAKPRNGRFCSIRCFRHGSLNPQWAGDAVSYRGLHQRIARERGKAAGCTIRDCVTGSCTFHWANLTGDHLNVADYAAMCVWHHRLYDSALMLGMSPAEALERVTAVPAEVQRTRSQERWAAARLTKATA